jgi:hypothetical protein
MNDNTKFEWNLLGGALLYILCVTINFVHECKSVENVNGRCDVHKLMRNPKEKNMSLNWGVYPRESSHALLHSQHGAM